MSKMTKFLSVKILRNVVLLILLSWILVVPTSHPTSANITVLSQCRELTIGPASAFCLGVSFCEWGVDTDYIVFLWMSNNTVCPNFTPPVVDSVATDAVVGSPGIIGTARSTALG